MAATMEVAVPPMEVAVTPGRRGHRYAVLAGAALAIALAAAALFVSEDGPGAAEDVRFGLVAAWALAGAVVASRATQSRLGGGILAGSVLAGLCALANALVHDGAGGLAGTLAELARPLAVALLPAVAAHVAAALPDGHLGRGGRRVAVAGVYATGLATGLALWTQRPDLPAWPVAGVGAVAVAVGLPAAHQRYRESRGPERQRLQWIGLALALVVQAGLVVMAFRLLVGWPEQWHLVLGAASVLLPAAFAAGASRRLVGRVDRALAHTVSITGLSAVVVGVYLVVVVGLGRSPTEAERGLLLLSMVAAGVSALVFTPARERLSVAANRLVYGERRAPDEALHTFGSRLTRAIPLEELLLQLAESLHQSMGLSSSEVWKGSSGFLERAASVPDRGSGEVVLGDKELPVVARAGVSGGAWAAVWLPAMLEGRAGGPVRLAPVTHSGELLGLIAVERRPGDDEFSEEDERVLTELARQLGLALHNSQLDSALQASLDQVRKQAKELQVSRARIVAAADAERRKIERNLHDGAQQHLVALAVKLRLIEQIAEQDMGTAKSLLEETRHDVQETIEELRTLAHGIYPPLLMDRGLPEALRAAAGRAVLPVDVLVGDGVGRYPQEVEAAVYFCCLEALQNAGKHAGEGATVRLHVRRERDTLRFDVVDDGVGFDRSAGGGGAGFTNMADRVGAMGGTVRVESAPGEGVRIAGEIPVGPEGGR